MLRNDYKSEVSRSNFVDSSIGASVSSKWATNSEFTSVSKQRPRDFKHSPRSSGDRSQKVDSWLEDNNNIAINDSSGERPLRDTDSRSSFTYYSDLEEPRDVDQQKFSFVLRCDCGNFSNLFCAVLRCGIRKSRNLQNFALFCGKSKFVDFAKILRILRFLRNSGLRR